jgi:membrane glycosyltransferase
MARLKARRRIRRIPARPAPVSAGPGPFLQSVPGGARLAMPTQDLRRASATTQPRSAGVAWRRTLLLGATGTATAGAGAVMLHLLASHGLTAAEIALLGLFLVLFAWIAFAFVSAVAGFLLAWRAPDFAPWRPQPVVFTRTALLMPTYNEDPGRILAAVQAICEDLAGKGVAELYDVFVLSDTRDQSIAQAEVTGVLRLRLRLGDPMRLFYRRRTANTGRKAGNIADWVRRFGAGYEQMLILDADSLMSADTIVRLTAAMERAPDTGLIQTLPLIVGARTLFGRLQQFAARTYGPVIALGQNWWSGAEGNYWGHNAMIRTRAFAEHAGLPYLAGPRPFGGHIMSHDFVEAALLRRGRWAVRMAATLPGSYEETPPTILDAAQRDRRWCQGNLQHAAVLGAAGLHWISRLHLLRGILSYLTAPLWLAFLALGAWVWVQQDKGGAGGAALGPVFALTMALLLAPKLMAAALVLRHGHTRRATGGGRAFAASVAAEIMASALIAPAMMLTQSRAVFQVLIGRDAGWRTQQRDPDRMKLREAWRAHRGHVLAGLAGGLIAWRLDPALFWWTSPITAGLALSAVLGLVTGRCDVGDRCRRLGLFLTPEERLEPQVVARAADLRAAYEAEADTRVQIARHMRAPVPHHAPGLRRPHHAFGSLQPVAG